MNTCSNCSNTIEQSALFCNNCGFPENGTSQEKTKYHANKVMKKNKHFDADKKVKSARTTLYVIAGITLLTGFFYYAMEQDIALLVVNIVLSIIYGILGYWSSSKPLAALLSALLLFVTIIVINAIVDLTTIYQGIIMKIIVLSYLGKGLYSAKAAQDQMQAPVEE